MSTLLALSLVLLPAATPPAAQMQMRQQPRVVASASATVGVEADAATLTVAVETRASSAKVAAEDNAERLKRVLDELDDAGYDDDEVATSGYSLWPYGGRGENDDEGYVAVNTITVRIDDIDDVGEVIDRVIGAGANRIPSVSFVADDIEDARHKALEQAIRQARDDAEVMARSAGGELGELIELSTQGVQDVPMRATMSLQGGTPVVGPTQQVTVHVTTIWGLR
ncbi:MAG: SIMPL domain-containing protein [Acidobacteriota bacterium]|jgi:hypothetical protein